MGDTATPGAAIIAWAAALGDTKSYMDALDATRAVTVATTPPESQAVMRDQIDTMARFKMLGTYNPGVTAISTGLSNLTDPSSPVAGVSLTPNGSTTTSSSATRSTAAPSGASSGGSAGGGGGGQMVAGRPRPPAGRQPKPRRRCPARAAGTR